MTIRSAKEMTMTGHIGMLGMIPLMLSPHDERPMVEQLNEGYQHGGGWQPFKGFSVNSSGDYYYLTYPNDPPYKERARITMNGETLAVFDSAWVLVIDKEGKNHIARMD
jgi:hypothetical protein